MKKGSSKTLEIVKKSIRQGDIELIRTSFDKLREEVIAHTRQVYLNGHKNGYSEGVSNFKAYYTETDERDVPRMANDLMIGYVRPRLDKYLGKGK